MQQDHTVTISETDSTEKPNVEPIVRRRTPDVLLAASRQYQHNDCSGFVTGFDYDETVKVVLRQENRQDAADQLINSLLKEIKMDPQDENYTPLEVATALSLYAFNVSPLARAEKLYTHFNGDCLEMDELVNTLEHSKGYEATELPAPTADIYVKHAMKKYGEEAVKRVRINL